MSYDAAVYNPPLMPVSQLTPDGALAHLLTLEGLPVAAIERLFELAGHFNSAAHARTLENKLLVNIFFESSTRTRTAFEAAAKQLGAAVVNLDQIRMAGASKSESLQDTVRTVSAMGAAGVVLRHWENGAAQQAADAAPPGVAVINGGDGCHAHPTQGLTDAYTLRQEVRTPFAELSVAIVGDVLHSRVARSDVHILRALGVRDIRLTGPAQLCPPSLAKSIGAEVVEDLDGALAGADVVILLRIQRERLREKLHLPEEEYLRQYGLTPARAARLKREAVIMHPGPINRNVEVADSVADAENSLILKQVAYGMGVRKAVLHTLLAGGAAV